MPTRVRAFMVTMAAALALASCAASARAGREAVIEHGLPRRAPTALDSLPHPWPGVALLLSAAGAALPIAVVTRPHTGEAGRTLLGAEIVTPAAGHLYAGLNRRALEGVAARAVGFGLVASGWGRSGEVFDGAASRVLLGATIILVSAAFDVVTVPIDTDHANVERVRARAALGVRAAPVGGAPGLALTVRF